MGNRTGDDLTLIAVNVEKDVDRLGRTTVEYVFDGQSFVDCFNITVAKARESSFARAKQALRVFGPQHPSGEDGDAVYRVFNDKLITAVALASAPDKEKTPPTTAEIFEKWAASVLNRERPTLYRVAREGNLTKFPIGEGIV